MSVVPRDGRKPHCDSGKTSSATARSLSSRTHAKIFPTMLRREMPRLLPQTERSPFLKMVNKANALDAPLFSIFPFPEEDVVGTNFGETSLSGKSCFGEGGDVNGYIMYIKSIF
ncbi:hypothetical protein JOB18_038994 [Solea senegalensis]|uniref:Uncharacterized protein n=1 Tax=Solea senegalensis TaxID=28829 RepID=A0AAV6PDB9_SOLSE|nr:hypothetical protein JOB18_038994 [Solea senegalensis]